MLKLITVTLLFLAGITYNYYDTKNCAEQVKDNMMIQKLAYEARMGE